MFNLPDMWNKVMVDTQLKLSGMDLKSSYGQRLHGEQNFWTQIRLCHVPDLEGQQETFCNLNQHEDSQIIRMFGSAQPGADRYLLHTGPAKNREKNIPVLLVHGAALNGNSWSIDFAETGVGLARYLTNKGFGVYGVSFAHPHGDNRIQAIQLAHAVDIIMKETGAEQIDLVCHSKGGIACRTWMQDLAPVKYRGQVRRLCLIGVPNKGMDLVFRHPMMSFLGHIFALSSVSAYDKMINMGMLMETARQSIYKDGTFQGQSQLLVKWTDRYALDPLEPDAEVVYHGGWGIFGHSRGIDAAIEDGGNFMEKLNHAPFPGTVEVALLGGSNQMYGALPGENCASSDGMILLESALYDEPFTRAHARVLTRDSLPINHLEILYDVRAADWVYECLTMA